ncbi:MAG: hypothetical protein PQJ61_14150 [Spirochaetales bacterium]|uniref:Uncharacterized protein n=1 Tax=Candidatus Thalassospirochaeta sargassi TaxID=3119039 RepID=A0AAJ1IGR9_9SPIO|nr:hypothetical protein [Spirochaetales bacterium]
MMEKTNTRQKMILIFARLSFAIIGFLIAALTAKQGQEWLVLIGTAAGFLVGHIVVTLVMRLIEKLKGDN